MFLPDRAFELFGRLMITDGSLSQVLKGRMVRGIKIKLHTSLVTEGERIASYIRYNMSRENNSPIEHRATQSHYGPISGVMLSYSKDFLILPVTSHTYLTGFHSVFSLTRIKRQMYEYNVNGAKK